MHNRHESLAGIWYKQGRRETATAAAAADRCMALLLINNYTPERRVYRRAIQFSSLTSKLFTRRSLEIARDEFGTGRESEVRGSERRRRRLTLFSYLMLLLLLFRELPALLTYEPFSLIFTLQQAVRLSPYFRIVRFLNSLA